MPKIGSKAGIEAESGFITMQAIDRVDKNVSDLQDLQRQILARVAGTGSALAGAAVLTLGDWVELASVKIEKATRDSNVLVIGSVSFTTGTVPNPDSFVLALRFRRGFKALAGEMVSASYLGDDLRVIIPHSLLDTEAMSGPREYFLDARWVSNGGVETADPDVQEGTIQVAEIL